MDSKTQKNILIAFFLNISFSLIEFVGGLMVGSTAILSDAIHDFGDALSIFLSYVLEKKSIKRADKSYTYGYVRYSILGSLFTIIILVFGSVLAIANAVHRIFNPIEMNYSGIIILAIIGFVINLIAMLVTSKGRSLNQKSVNLHMLEDVLGWLSVLIGSIIMKLTNIQIIDPILSITIAVFILIHSFKHLKSIVDILMEKSTIDVDNVKEAIKTVNGVVSIHHLHIWSLDGVDNYATMHIVMKANQKELKESIRSLLQERFNITHVTIELEAIWECCQNKTCSKSKQCIKCTCCNNDKE